MSPRFLFLIWPLASPSKDTAFLWGSNALPLNSLLLRLFTPPIPHPYTFFSKPHPFHAAKNASPPGKWRQLPCKRMVLSRICLVAVKLSRERREAIKSMAMGRPLVHGFVPGIKDVRPAGHNGRREREIKPFLSSWPGTCHATATRPTSVRGAPIPRRATRRLPVLHRTLSEVDFPPF